MEIKAELLYPYTEEERMHFIVEQNHRNGYEIREVETEYEKTNIISDYEDKEIIEENEAPKYEFQDVTTIIEVNDYDEEGNVIGTHQKEQIEKKMVQVGTMIEKTARIEKVLIGTHEEKELVKGINLQAWGYTQEEIEEQKHQQFLKEFFNTSLGYVRRKVSMKTGETKDFLADILPILQVGIPILTYTEEGEQNKVLVTEEFIDECKQQVIKDFYGV